MRAKVVKKLHLIIRRSQPPFADKPHSC